MEFVPLELREVVLVKPKVHGDERGFFLETWREDVFREAGIAARFVQDNHSRSASGILRGLHYQLVQPQGKLVRVVSGEVFDVAVDVRRSSPTFGRWVGAHLSASNQHMLWVPPGFAHGFLVLSTHADFVYKCTDYYHPGSERCLLWNDPAVDIEWPFPQGREPTLSAKDAQGALLAKAETFP